MEEKNIVNILEEKGLTISLRRINDNEYKKGDEKTKTAYKYGFEIKINDKIYGKDIDFFEVKIPRSNNKETLNTNIEWGYGGSSPTQLARIILKAILEDDGLVNRFYNDFVDEIIAKIDRRIDKWEITEIEVWDWLINKVKQLEKENYGIYLVLMDKLNKIFKNRFGIDLKEVYKNYEPNIVKKVCKELGITQKELAEKMGVNDVTVRTWSSKGNVPEWAIKFMNLLLEYEKVKEKADKAKQIAILLDELKN